MSELAFSMFDVSLPEKIFSCETYQVDPIGQIPIDTSE